MKSLSRWLGAACRPVGVAVLQSPLVWLVVSLAPGAATAETPQTIAKDVLSSSAYQQVLPDGALADSRQALDPADLQPFNFDLIPPDWLLDVAVVLVYCLLGACVLGIAAYLYRLYRARAMWGNEPDQPHLTGEAATHLADPTLRDADALAAEGRFADAVHLLLVAALAYLQQRIAPGLADSLTSREVIDTVSMSEEGRAALLGIVGTVEVSHFGGRAVDGEGYGRCRDMFAALTRQRADAT